jgi:valine--pyruvate aminotransferase
MKLSLFGKKVSQVSGIGRLMQDLGAALSQRRDMLMLGGGNPAHIPQVQKYFRQSMENLLRNGSEFERTVGNYDPPGGNTEFIAAVAALLNRELRWNITPRNIALTNGSQTAFFILFNIFAGAFEEGLLKKILFPLAPEYIGYCDIGLVDDLFIANKPQIEYVEDHIFKYHIDFDRLKITDDIGAICVSRPTNPTGNVLTDSEIRKLSDIARDRDIPLIVDNAYGSPFPDIVFTRARPLWNQHTVFCMSLSKLGLPAARTGIIIAAEEVISTVSKVNAVMSLAPGGMGAAIAADLVSTGRIIDLSRDVIRPFYHKKARAVMHQVLDEFDGIDFYVHRPEGAFFLWLWFPNLPITSRRLYHRLKQRGVLIVPGRYFFPGLTDQWPHKNECIRINYSQDARAVAAGIEIIAEEVKKAYE